MKMKDQDAVIKALKQQVADLEARTSEIATRNKEVAALTKTNAALTAENKRLADSLNTAQKENSTLNTKLAAARSSSQPEAKVPGSAVKARTTGVVLPGTAEAAKDAMLQKQKVEMYCDLTNLVIVAIKKNEDDEDVYDCLQTGRNGSKSYQSQYQRLENLTWNSAALPPHRLRGRRELCRHRVLLPAAAGRAEGQGSARLAARLSHRGD